MSQDLRELTDLDRVIHEPARLTIVALLYGVKEADFLYLQRESDADAAVALSFLLVVIAVATIGLVARPRSVR